MTAGTGDGTNVLTDPAHVAVECCEFSARRMSSMQPKWFRSLRNKRPVLSGRPHCKGVAIGVARRGARRSGERTLRILPSCSFPVSHVCGPHVASFVRRSSVRGLANARACGRAWRAAQCEASRKKEQPAKKRVGTLKKKRKQPCVLRMRDRRGQWERRARSRMKERSAGQNGNIFR